MFFFLKTVNLLLENWFLSLISYEIRTLYKVFKVTQELHMKYLLISFIFLVGCPGKNAAVKTEKGDEIKDAGTTPAENTTTGIANGGTITSATPASTTGATATPLTPVITNPTTSVAPTEAGYTVTKSGIKIYVATADLSNVKNIQVPPDKKFLEVRINLDKEAFKKALNAQRVVDDEGKKIQTSAVKPTAVTMKLATSYANISTKKQTDQPSSNQPVDISANGDIVGVETVNATVAYGQGCCPIVQISCESLKGQTKDCALAKNASLNALATAAITSHANFYRATARAEDIAAQYVFPCEQK